MWPETGELEMLAARAMNEQHTNGNAGYDKDYELMVRLLDKVTSLLRLPLPRCNLRHED